MYLFVTTRCMKYAQKGGKPAFLSRHIAGESIFCFLFFEDPVGGTFFVASGTWGTLK